MGLFDWSSWLPTGAACRSAHSHTHQMNNRKSPVHKTCQPDSNGELLFCINSP